MKNQYIFKPSNNNTSGLIIQVSFVIACVCVIVNTTLLRWAERSSNRVMEGKSIFSRMYLWTPIPPTPERTTLSPCSSMYFFSSVVQYCGLSSVEAAHCGGSEWGFHLSVVGFNRQRPNDNRQVEQQTNEILKNFIRLSVFGQNFRPLSVAGKSQLFFWR